MVVVVLLLAMVVVMVVVLLEQVLLLLLSSRDRGPSFVCLPMNEGHPCSRIAFALRALRVHLQDGLRLALVPDQFS
jgi:hypothetical protein